MQRDNKTLRNLKAYVRKSVLTEREMEAHWNEFSGKNDRLVAILGATAIEGALTGVLKRQMPKLSSDLESAVFGFRSPLGTLSAKADLAAALGLITASAHRNVDYIREIRNAFAHTIMPLRFQNRTVSDLCKLLVYSEHVGKKSLQTWGGRRRFLAAVIDTGRAIWGHHILPP